MTPQTFTGSRWATVPRTHYPANVHHCNGCARCERRIDAAQDDALWEGHDDWAADDAAEREMGWRES
jgi:hypothetical protein